MKNLIKLKWLLLVLGAFIFENNMNAQGCVAVRATGCSGTTNSSTLSKNQLEFSTNFRYFESHRHFVGDVEQKEREELHTEVRIKSFAYDFGFNYGVSDRFFVNFSVPFVINNRSNNHYTDKAGVAKRFSVQGRGLGDIRATGYYWILAPKPEKKLSLLGGLGVKLPTGDPSQIDVFHALSSKGKDSTYFKIVDQAIQPGDAGFGISLESQINYRIASKLNLYASGYYLFQPQETSNVLRNTALSETDTIQNYLSITDQFLARVGVSVQPLSNKYPLTISLGGRLEGVPSHDAIGGSNGRRRPGYTVTAEPSINYDFGSDRINFSIPISLYRNRTKSVYDLSDPTGKTHGDAAFADYSINVSYVHRFGSSHIRM